MGPTNEGPGGRPVTNEVAASWCPMGAGWERRVAGECRCGGELESVILCNEVRQLVSSPVSCSRSTSVPVLSHPQASALLLLPRSSGPASTPPRPPRSCSSWPGSPRRGATSRRCWPSLLHLHRGVPRTYPPATSLYWSLAWMPFSLVTSVKRTPSLALSLSQLPPAPLLLGASSLVKPMVLLVQPSPAPPSPSPRPPSPGPSSPPSCRPSSTLSSTSTPPSPGRASPSRAPPPPSSPSQAPSPGQPASEVSWSSLTSESYHSSLNQ